MALEFEHGSVEWTILDAVGTIYTINGLSFQPKAIRFYTNGWVSAVDSASEVPAAAKKNVAFAVSATSRALVVATDTDGSGSMSCRSGYHTDCIAQHVTSTGKLDIDSFTSDGFTLRVDEQATGNSLTVFWEAWGGSDISVNVVGSIAEPAAIGNVDYTVTGFVAGATDQVVMFAGVQSVSAAGTNEAQDSGLCVGFAKATPSENVVVLGNNDDGSASADTDGYCQTGECLAMITVGGGNPNARAQLTQFGTDNFRLNWFARALTDRRYIFLAIKGGSWAVGDYSINGNTGGATGVVSGLPFAPKGLSLIGRMTVANGSAVATAEDRIGFGSGSSPTSRRAMGHLSEDGTANAEIDLCIEYDQVLAFPSTAGALLAAYDISAMNADGFEIIVDVAGGVLGEWQGYLAFGDADAPPPSAGASRWSFIGAA